MTAPSPLQRSIEFSFLLFLSLVLVFPVVLGWIKLLLLAYIVAAVVIVDTTSRKPVISVHASVLVFMFSMILVNALFVLRGLLNGASAEGSLEVVFVYLVYPVFYLALIFLSPSIIDVNKLAKTLVLVSLVVSFLTIAQGLRVLSANIVPGYSLLYYLYPGLVAGYMDYAFTGLDGFLPRASERLIFLAPFSVGLLVAGKTLGLSRAWVLVNLFAVTAATAFTGRRAILLILILAVVTLVVRWFLRAPRRSAGIVGICATSTALLLAGVVLVGMGSVSSGIGNDPVNDYVLTEFGNFKFDIRTTQLEKIFSKANEEPLLGIGFGRDIAGYIRDPVHPWRVELTYLALAFQTGAIGILLYLFVAKKLLNVVTAAMHSGGIVLFPFIMGLGGGLLAAATNPYLNYGTGQWILFLPVAIFNAVLVAGACRSATGAGERA